MNAQRDDVAYFYQSIRAHKKHEIEKTFYRVELHIAWVTERNEGDKLLKKVINFYKKSCYNNLRDENSFNIIIP